MQFLIGLYNSPASHRVRDPRQSWIQESKYVVDFRIPGSRFRIL